MRPTRVLVIAAVAITAFCLDRVTKGLVVAMVPLHESREVVGSFVRITHTQNTGAAFGLLPERTALLSSLSVFAVAAILYFYRRVAARSLPIALTLGMILGGAIGNLVDRVTLGYVVDFVDVGVGGVRYWAFNVADSSIVVGILLVTGLLWLEDRRGA